jgi:DNA-binding SARP family transcriptional activator
MTGEWTVQVIGGLAVCTRGGLLRGSALGSRKARTVLALLAVSSGHASPDRLAAALWGDRPPRDPPANVATLVSRLRALLGGHAIVKEGAGYRLGVRVDLRHAADLVASAPVLPTASHALRLLEGEVLPELPDTFWVEPARTWHRDLLRRARHALTLAALAAGEIEPARSTAEVATQVDPFDETAWRLLMRAHHAAGEPARAVLAYERLRSVLSTELGIDPAPATRDLHLFILRGTPVSTT